MKFERVIQAIIIFGLTSTFSEDAKWRQKKEAWLKWSRGMAWAI